MTNSRTARHCSRQSCQKSFDSVIRRELGSLNCPNSITKSIRRDGDENVVVQLRCKRNTCAVCRRANAQGFLTRAEEGITRDLAAGCTLAAIDTDTCSAGAMESRLRRMNGYIRLSLAGRTIVVVTLTSGIQLPPGFCAVSTERAGKILRLLDRLADDDATFAVPEDRKKSQPFSLSYSWSNNH